MVSIASVTLLFLLRFIYFWLYWVCVAVFRLSLVRCEGFSLWWLLSRCMGFRAWVQQLWPTGLIIL